MEKKFVSTHATAALGGAHAILIRSKRLRF